MPAAVMKDFSRLRFGTPWPEPAVRSLRPLVVLLGVVALLVLPVEQGDVVEAVPSGGYFTAHDVDPLTDYWTGMTSFTVEHDVIVRSAVIQSDAAVDPLGIYWGRRGVDVIPGATDEPLTLDGGHLAAAEGARIGAHTEAVFFARVRLKEGLRAATVYGILVELEGPDGIRAYSIASPTVLCSGDGTEPECVAAAASLPGDVGSLLR